LAAAAAIESGNGLFSSSSLFLARSKLLVAIQARIAMREGSKDAPGEIAWEIQGGVRAPERGRESAIDGAAASIVKLAAFLLPSLLLSSRSIHSFTYASDIV